jgi:eukaryotic-like serine/threonine-protein kinase
VASTERWHRVQQIFLEAADLSPDEQAAFLERSCLGDAPLRNEVEALLRADKAGEAPLSAAIQQQAESLVGRTAVEGSRLGSYRVIREIGRGGMGVVYLAARADEEYESEVAIKLVRPGFDTDFVLRRFRRERQILARLEHPNIARLLDGGTTEQQIPYLVMEYINGSWITNYSTEHQLSVSDRLRLFLPVCSAVEHAHRAFIVHRDLKPANILIDNHGSPKLLDFGISKLLRSEPADSSETQSGGMMTPDYASPEQISGDPVTVTSDIYSLGAVLYELLTGLRPHRVAELTPRGLERAICHEPIVAPSAAVHDNPALARRLAGDLDNIILRAMQKDPARRNPSVEHFAEDLRRHLDHRPVTARPDSPGYRAGRFIRRNRVAITFGAAVAAGMVTTAAFALHASRTSNQRLRQVINLGTAFCLDAESAARSIPGAQTARWAVAQASLRYLDSLSRSSGTDPELKREIAASYGRIGEDLERDAPPDSVTLRSMVARAWQAAGSVYAALAAGEGNERRMQDEDTARAWFQRALAEWRKIEGQEEFLPQLRKEMEAAAAALTELTQRGPVQ